MPKENASYIITSRFYRGDNGVAMGYSEKKKDYVTWAYIDGSFHWGHYFTNEKDAKKDFVKRIEKELY